MNQLISMIAGQINVKKKGISFFFTPKTKI